MGTRKNQASLTPSERAAFVAAVKALKASGVYDTFVDQHRAAFMARQNDPAHNGPGFLPWHREYLRRFERALQSIDPSVSLPYWDWTVDNSPTSSLWDASFMGGDGSGPDQRVTTGPFASATGQWTLTVLDPGETRSFLRRELGHMGSLPTRPQVDRALNVVPYDRAPWHFQSPVDAGNGFRAGLEGGIHNPGHMWTGGSMMDMSSPNDPVFWLHHCNIDRLWAEWQFAHPNEAYRPSSGTSGVVSGHALDDPMRPWTQEPAPPTPRSVLDHHALGYTYDFEVEPAVGDPFGYPFINETTGLVEQHNLFRSADGHIHALWFNFSDGWHHEDRTTLLPGVPPAVGDPFGYPFINETTGLVEQHNLFRSADGHIHALWFNFSDGWHHEDRTTLLPGVPPAVGDPFGYPFINETTGLVEQHNLFRSADGHIHALWFNFSDGWHHEDRTTLLPGVPPAVGDPFGYPFINETTGLVEQHNLFRSADGHIHALWFNFSDGWHHEDRTTLLPGVPPAVGDPFGYPFINETTGLVEQHNLFRSADGHIHALWFNFSDGWHHEDRTTLLPGVPPAVGDPFGYPFINETTGLVEQHNLFRSADGHIHALWFNFSDGWHHEDRTTLLPGVPPAVGDPFGYPFINETTGLVEQHNLFRSADGHIHALWFNFSDGWHHEDRLIQRRMKKLGWSPNVRISGQQSKAAPALATFGERLHLVHLGSESNDLWHSTSGGGTPNVPIPGQQSKAAPSLAAFGGRLHLVHLGSESNDLWHSTFDGTWSPNVPIPGQQSKAAPSLAAFGGRLHLVHLGSESNDLWHSTFDGTWSPNVPIPGQQSKAAPALAAFGGRLHLVHLGSESNDLWHSTFDGTWSPNVRIADQQSKAAPALAAFGGRLHLVHLGSESNDLWHSTFDGTWSPNVRIADQQSKAAPALAAFGERLHLVHLGSEANDLWHASYGDLLT